MGNTQDGPSNESQQSGCQRNVPKCRDFIPRRRYYQNMSTTHDPCGHELLNTLMSSTCANTRNYYPVGGCHAPPQQIFDLDCGIGRDLPALNNWNLTPRGHEPLNPINPELDDIIRLKSNISDGSIDQENTPPNVDSPSTEFNNEQPSHDLLTSSEFYNHSQNLTEILTDKNEEYGLKNSFFGTNTPQLHSKPTQTIRFENPKPTSQKQEPISDLGRHTIPSINPKTGTLRGYELYNPFRPVNNLNVDVSNQVHEHIKNSGYQNEPVPNNPVFKSIINHLNSENIGQTDPLPQTLLHSDNPTVSTSTDSENQVTRPFLKLDPIPFTFPLTTPIDHHSSQVEYQDESSVTNETPVKRFNNIDIPLTCEKLNEPTEPEMVKAVGGGQTIKSLQQRNSKSSANENFTNHIQMPIEPEIRIKIPKNDGLEHLDYSVVDNPKKNDEVVPFTRDKNQQLHPITPISSYEVSTVSPGNGIEMNLDRSSYTRKVGIVAPMTSTTEITRVDNSEPNSQCPTDKFSFKNIEPLEEKPEFYVPESVQVQEPSAQITQVNIPQFKIPEPKVSVIQILDFKVPETQIIKPVVPTITISYVEASERENPLDTIPRFETPEPQTPKVKGPKISISEPQVTGFEISDFKNPNTLRIEPLVPRINAPDIEPPDPQFSQEVKGSGIEVGVQVESHEGSEIKPEKDEQPNMMLKESPTSTEGTPQTNQSEPNTKPSEDSTTTITMPPNNKVALKNPILSNGNWGFCSVGGYIFNTFDFNDPDLYNFSTLKDPWFWLVIGGIASACIFGQNRLTLWLWDPKQIIIEIIKHYGRQLEPQTTRCIMR